MKETLTVAVGILFLQGRKPNHDSLAEPRDSTHPPHGRRHAAAELFSEDDRRLHVSRGAVCGVPGQLGGVALSVSDLCATGSASAMT